MSYISVAGIQIWFRSFCNFSWANLSVFLIRRPFNVEVKVQVDICSEIMPKIDGMYFNDRLTWLKKESSHDDFIVYQKQLDSEKIGRLLEFDPNCSKASIQFSDDIDTNLPPLSDVLFRNRILFHQGLVLHSSAIKYCDKAILFTAPSGTGKSTMAHLWVKHKNAVILNGDSPAIRMMGDRPIVFGTPWSGSKPEFVNDSAPLKAIVVLEQAPENRIRKLDAYEYVTRVLPRVFLPYFDQGLMGRALENFEKIVGSVPVYLLQCRPDQEAVELVHQCLF